LEVRAAGASGSAAWFEESCRFFTVTKFGLPESCHQTLSLSWGLEQENPLSPVGREKEEPSNNNEHRGL